MNAAESDILKAVKEHRELKIEDKTLIVSQPAMFLQLREFQRLRQFLNDRFARFLLCQQVAVQLFV